VRTKNEIRVGREEGTKNEGNLKKEKGRKTLTNTMTSLQTNPQTVNALLCTRIANREI